MISVIVPIYNCEKYLRACVTSIQRQTFSDIEIILVDDGSLDNSYPLAKTLARQDARITLAHQKNQGPSAARNRGMELAKGEFIVFIDADDVIDTELINTLYTQLQAVRADIATMNYHYSLSPIAHSTNQRPRVFNQTDALRDILYQHTIESGPVAKLLPRSLIDGLRFAEDTHIAEDLEFNCRAFLRATRIVNITTPLYTYEQHESSVSRSAFDAKRMSALLAMQRIKLLLNHLPAVTSAVQRRYFVEALSILIEYPDMQRHHPMEFRECCTVINKYRQSVIWDMHVSAHHRIAATVSYLGMPPLIALYTDLKQRLRK